MKRRKFLKLASLTTAALPLGALAKRTALLNGAPAFLEGQDTLFEIFRSPQNKYRPFVRWWWNGDRVTKEEVLRELDVMQKAGIGGVEINPIKWNEQDDAVGIKELTWGSDEWLEVVETAVKGAKERGMTCDMIVGSGWPYGGEFVPLAEQSQIMLLGTKNLEGGKEY
ncbi:MAG TPA: glycosyl hydrolase, partial [Puia sp.]|nr:glycosyl hydrolase [Puia sp.]